MTTTMPWHLDGRRLIDLDTHFVPLLLAEVATIFILVFIWGSQIADPDKMLLGKGNQYRYILVKNKTDFPKAYIKKLLKEAYANSLAKVKDKSQMMQGATMTKSISAVERKSGRVAKKKK